MQNRLVSDPKKCWSYVNNSKEKVGFHHQCSLTISSALAQVIFAKCFKSVYVTNDISLFRVVTVLILN